MEQAGVSAEDVACVLAELYQGSSLRKMEPTAARNLREWCDRHDALLVFDEVQSGFGRTGSLFAYERTGVRPDLLLCGKGISGSLPVSAVLVADTACTEHLRPGELTNTHGGNPVSLAAVEANLALFADGRLVEAAACRGAQLAEGLAQWAARSPGREVVGAHGMVAGVAFRSPDGTFGREQARLLVAECAQRGLLLCAAPAGLDGTMVKIMPPLTTTEADLGEGLARFGVAADAVQHR